MITDPSFPHGASVSDEISLELTSLSYVTVDNVADIVHDLGKGTLLVKADIEAAYWLIPVHPQDRILKGIEWDGQFYVDSCLPFSLQSAPKLFNAVADALCWCLRQAGIFYLLHYLDDFNIIALPGSRECSEAVEVLQQTCT